MKRLLYWLVKWIKTAEADRVLADARRLADDYQKAIDKADHVYTTIRSFRDEPAAYWQWAKAVLDSDQFRFLVFQLRENIIREMSGCYDKDKLIAQLGRMEMLHIISNYLRSGIDEYENSIRRTKEEVS